MSDSEVFHLCGVVLGEGISWPDDSDSVLPQAVGEYAVRCHAAAELTARFPDSPLVQSVLLRTALDSTDDDRVRMRAIQGLLDVRAACLPTAALALVFDADSEMRLAALETLWLTRDPMLRTVAELLASDSDESIRRGCHDILTGGELGLYRMSGPRRALATDSGGTMT